MLQYTNDINKILDYQYGFRIAHSAVTNLLSFTKIMRESLDMGIQINILYTNFEKAL